ncbi:Acyl-[acyl-carrier-protein]--UDP-N-acetylglucosamine O-acyltransferase [hydrothermal vent metagenome]|uniref:Acyl-[acyl-carrier-protein]--UDP-N-acetylglucosamine O-acyltransferase n=1 Tax=hydrothermal vent metagenome TaxID=652676 RepID=A0A3B1DY11_9ZZZZ
MPTTPTTIHPTAIISPEADLAEGVQIGPFCTITGRVTLGPGVRLIASAHIQGPATIGEGTTLYPGACIGFEPQDSKFTPGSPTAGVVIGARCLLREQATIHAATSLDTPTTLGDECFLMACSHVGHDCRIGNNVILVNYTGISGHCEVGDNATFSGHVGLHQFVRIGRLAFLSGGVAVGMDVPPFCMVNERNRLGGLNLVGMRRNGIPRAEITEVRRAFRECFRTPIPTTEMLAMLDERSGDSPAVAEIAEFVRGSTRGVCPGMGRPPRVLTTWLQRRRRGEILDDVGHAQDD